MRQLQIGNQQIRPSLLFPMRVRAMTTIPPAYGSVFSQWMESSVRSHICSRLEPASQGIDCTRWSQAKAITNQETRSPSAKIAPLLCLFVAFVLFVQATVDENIVCTILAPHVGRAQTSSVSFLSKAETCHRRHKNAASFTGRCC